MLVLCSDAGIPLYGPSGASVHLRGLAGAFRRAGWQAAVAVPLEVDHRGRHGQTLDLPVTTVAPTRLASPARLLGEWWSSRRLGAAVDRPVDVVYERHSLMGDGGMALVARWRAAGCTVKHVVELDAPIRLERARFHRPARGPLPGWVEGRVLRSADLVVAVSAWLAAWAIEEIGCDPERVIHVPNGTAYVRLGDREGTRQSLGLEGLVVGFVGSFKPWHGVGRLASILEALPEATMLVVGDGPANPPKHPRLIRSGRVDPAHLPDLVAAMDVGLAPYSADAPPWMCPLKVFDYRAQGVPVVVTATGEGPSLVADGSGEAVAGEDPVAWADAIRRQAATVRVRRIRSWDVVLGEILAHPALEAVAATGPRRAAAGG